MKNLKYLILPVMIFAGSTQVLASDICKYKNYSCDCSCVQEETNELNTKTQYVGECTQWKPLALTQDTFGYQSLGGNIYTVRYWQGSFVRDLQTTTTSLHTVYDKCASREILSEQVPEVETEKREFALANPNLDRGIDATYKLAPMTDDEAKTAFQNALLECKNAK